MESSGHVSPPIPKCVTFELIYARQSSQSPNTARLPLRVQIYPHDTTESIVTTVKNFWGLYPVPVGVSFEDPEGNTLIARYENFHSNMVIYVRAAEVPGPPAGTHSYPSHFYDNLGAGFDPERHNHVSGASRSPSPNVGRGRRSASASTSGKKSRSRSARNANYNDGDNMNGYSSGDNAPGSSSSKKDNLGNTEISLENIVEGGRRKRAKFESSVCFASRPLGSSSNETTGTPSVCASSDARVHVEPVGLAGPPHRLVPAARPVHEPQPLHGRQSSAVSSELQRCLRRYTRHTRPPVAWEHKLWEWRRGGAGRHSPDAGPYNWQLRVRGGQGRGHPADEAR